MVEVEIEVEGEAESWRFRLLIMSLPAASPHTLILSLAGFLSIEPFSSINKPGEEDVNSADARFFASIRSCMHPAS